MYLHSNTPFHLRHGRWHCLLRKFLTKLPKLNVFRILMFGSVLLGIIIGFFLWPIVEAHPSTIVLHSQSEMSRWLSKQFAHREGVISFYYKGDTKLLTEMIGQALSAALYSDPFIRYNVGKYSYQWKGRTDAAAVDVYVDYRETYEQSQYVRQQTRKIAHHITRPEQSPHIKVKAIYDYIISNVTYDESMTKFTTYEALVEGKTVCQGYTLLMQAMLEAIRIPSRIVEGKAGGLLHAWNLVQLDGRWYHIDATWGDPLPDRGKQVRYTYYMLTDAEIQLDHQWKESVELPKATTSYGQALKQMRQRGDKSMQSFVTLLERSWSPNILFSKRQS